MSALILSWVYQPQLEVAHSSASNEPDESKTGKLVPPSHQRQHSEHSLFILRSLRKPGLQVIISGIKLVMMFRADITLTYTAFLCNGDRSDGDRVDGDRNRAC